jgi:predicted regulator of Ras-like GTPase activity (Roadblock/LC7/MglB family)
MPIENRSDALFQVLANIHRDVVQVRGSAIITHDGLLIASYPPGWDADIHDPTGGENVAAMAAVVVGLAERTLTRLNQGELKRVVMEGARGSVCVLPATADSALALLVDSEARLGLALEAARRAAEQIRGILDNNA